MFFFNAVFLVLKKFKRSYFDLIMHKLTPNTFRIDSFFLAYMVTF